MSDWASSAEWLPGGLAPEDAREAFVAARPNAYTHAAQVSCKLWTTESVDVHFMAGIAKLRKKKEIKLWDETKDGPKPFPVAVILALVTCECSQEVLAACN